ncbi:hypothetical protein W97_07061 [Coniosporium apollinis CBS 100218]|uniref:G-protein coupled receptors family 2 profile 2 domain-containing protein n=1 Tax=Coniosporium apollinis (strain CBS 100218) TaxID=1168221 RepID=R7Z1L2_CONA1|nr:uncharacterized protein W97_07061 [Coniosporium apollinis CBS 100218]EON67806.1 hypothetical protein W97_07061 [Coniosporium apollinis CBS 100218]
MPDFASKLKIAQYCSIPSLLACAFLLFSFVFLPPEKSQRHYLSISFIIPLGTDPDLCYDQVTPHDMYSDMSCAWTGALLQVGGMGAVVWVLLRTAWLHIRICWDREPGLMFALFSMISGITIPAVFLASVLASSGVSYRTGQVCFANHDKSFAAYWAWLITFAGLSLVLQLITAVYCVYIFVRSQRREKARMRGGISSQTHRTAQEGGSQLRSGFERVRHSSVEWRKIRRLFLLQWRGIAISTLVVIQTVYFATTFINQDSKLDIGRTSAQDMLNFQAWGTCLVFAGGNKNACLSLAEKITGGPHIVISSVVWAGLSGVICFFFLARTSMFTAWLTLLTEPAHRLHTHLTERRAPKDEEHNPFSYASDKEAAKRISTAPSHSSPHRSAISRHRSRSSVVSTKTTSSAKSNTSGGSASGGGAGATNGKSPKHSPSNSQHKTLSIISESSPSSPSSPTTAAALAAAAADKSLPPTPGTPATPRMAVPSKYRVPARLNPVPRIVAVGPNAPTRVGLPKEVMVGGSRGSREVGLPPERKASVRASEAFPSTAARLAAEQELEGMLGIGGEGEGERDGGEGEAGEKEEKDGEQHQENGIPAPTSPPMTSPPMTPPPMTPPPSSPPPSSPPPSLPLPLEPPQQDIRHPSVLMPATAKAQLAAAVRAQVVRELAAPARSGSPLWGRPEHSEALHDEAESSKAGQLKAEREEAQQQGTLMPDPRTLLRSRGGLGMNPVVVEPAAEVGGQQAGKVEEEAEKAREIEEQGDVQPSVSVARKPVGGAAVAAQVEAIEKAEERGKVEQNDEEDDEKEQKEEKREGKQQEVVAVGEPSPKSMALTPQPKEEEASKAAPQPQTQTLLRTPSQHGPNWPLQSGPKMGEEDEDKDGTYFYAL